MTGRTPALSVTIRSPEIGIADSLKPPRQLLPLPVAFPPAPLCPPSVYVQFPFLCLPATEPDYLGCSLAELGTVVIFHRATG